MQISRLLFIESLLLILVVATSAIAQQEGKASLKTIAGKKKVYVETDVAASRKAIEKVLREEGGLEIASSRENADFLLYRSGYLEQKSDRPLTLNSDLPTLPE